MKMFGSMRLCLKGKARRQIRTRACRYPRPGRDINRSQHPEHRAALTVPGDAGNPAFRHPRAIGGSDERMPEAVEDLL